MRWSIRLGTAFGIPVYMHLTFVLLLAWVAISHWTQSKSIDTTFVGVLFIITIFGCVVLHEFGHALMARRYGIKTRDVTLLPIGGVARLEKMPDEPVQELWVALAGPAVNVVIAGVLAVGLSVTGLMQPLDRLSVTGGPFLDRLLAVNVFLVLFNMIPAFPMDGGRVLRALLATRMEYTRATQIAAVIGQSAALLFGFVGLFYNPLLLFIALFVWIGATQEASMVQMKSALGGIPVGRAMITNFQHLVPGDAPARAVDLTLSSSQKDFPVIDGQRIVGVLTQKGLFKALARRDAYRTVAEIMETQFETAEPAEMLDTVFQRFAACACHTIPVVSAGRLMGLVTMDNLGEFMAIQGALGKAAGGPAAAGR